MPASAKRLMLVFKTELAIPHSIHWLREMASFGGFWDLNQASQLAAMGSEAVRQLRVDSRQSAYGPLDGKADTWTGDRLLLALVLNRGTAGMGS
jgi:hypothetical protein